MAHLNSDIFSIWNSYSRFYLIYWNIYHVRPQIYQEWRCDPISWPQAQYSLAFSKSTKLISCAYMEWQIKLKVICDYHCNETFSIRFRIETFWSKWNSILNTPFDGYSMIIAFWEFSHFIVIIVKLYKNILYPPEIILDKLKDGENILLFRFFFVRQHFHECY